MKLLLLISLYLPLLAYGKYHSTVSRQTHVCLTAASVSRLNFLATTRQRTLDFVLAGSGVQETGAKPLEELTVTLNYSKDLIPNMANPKVYAGTCTETLPGGTPNLNDDTGFTVTSASAPTAPTYRLIFTMAPNDLGTYEPPTNTFIYCAHLANNNGRVRQLWLLTQASRSSQ